MASKKVPPPPNKGGETLDLNGTLVTGLTASGGFDPSQIQATPVGKLLHVLPIPVLLVNEALNVVFANQSCEKLGWSAESLRDAALDAAFPDVSTAQEVRDLVRRVFSTRKTQIKEMKWETDKKPKWGRLTVHSVRMSGERLALLKVEDATAETELMEEMDQKRAVKDELQHSERFLSTVLESIRDGICVLDTDLKVLRCNEAMGRLYPNSLSPQGRTCHEAYLGSDTPCESCPALRTLETGEPAHEIVRRVGPEGETIGWLDLNTFPMKHEFTGEVSGVIEYARDATESREAEKALRDREQLLTTVLAASPLGIGLSIDRRMVWGNDALVSMFGFTEEEEYVGKSLRMLYPSDEEFERVGKLAYSEAASAKTKEVEGKLRRKDRSLFDAMIRSRAVDPSDPSKGHIAAVADVTERKRAERALKESEARFREFAEALPQVVYELDCQGAITFVNDMGLALGGYSPEDLEKGLTLKDLVAPEDWERLLKNIDTALHGESTSGSEYTLVTKGGTRVPVAACTSPIVRGNEIVGLRGVCVDIRQLKEAGEILKRSRQEIQQLVTERTADLESVNEQLRGEIDKRIRIEKKLARSESRFRAIFETSPDCIFIKDSSLKYVLVNPAMSSVLEMPEPQILGRTDEELFGTAAAGHLKAVDTRVLNGDVVEEEHTLEVRGVHLTFLSIKAPLTDAEGHVIGVCGISKDITERRSFESLRRPAMLQYPSPYIKAAVAAAQLAASTDSTVLLTGESGSGKDFLARYIHEHSRRSTGPFYAINCASIPTELAESELFGHEAGAFTGASKRKRGLLELAEGGTILLNEIGELPLDLQAKLLTFLDTKSFTRIGGEKTVMVNVRLIAATNRDLTKEISEGRFRKDLFYRLDVFAIGVPPLRERLDDLPVLVEEQLSKLAPAFGSSRPVQIGAGVMELLRNYGWPGNVRELRNVLERALILSRGGPLRPEHFQFGRAPVQGESVSVFGKRSLPDLLGDIERSLIDEALRHSRGNRTEAADLLGLSRFALTRHMRKLGLP